MDGCGRRARARFLCSAHYQRWAKYGDPLAGNPLRIIGNIEARFWARVDKTDTCWLWTGGGVTRHGYFYGRLTVGRRQVLAHRYAYELLVSPIPEGLELDHICRVTRCVNPTHVEPVTHAENMRRSPLFPNFHLNASERPRCEGVGRHGPCGRLGPAGEPGPYFCFSHSPLRESA